MNGIDKILNFEKKLLNKRMKVKNYEKPMSHTNLPVLSPDSSLTRYLQEIRKFPMLEPEEEYMLAKSWAERGDSKAAHKLVTCI